MQTDSVEHTRHSVVGSRKARKVNYISVHTVRAILISREKELTDNSSFKLLPLKGSMVTMNTFKKSLVFLIFIIPFSLSNVGKMNESSIKLSDSQYLHCSNDSECPTWFMCNSSNLCQCGNTHDHAVVCDHKSLSSAVLLCYCVTYDRKRKSTNLGSCTFTCSNQKVGIVYEALSANSEMLTDGSVCADFNRAGLLCGDCKDGYSPFVLTYNLSCVRCPDGHKNWWKFILAGFVPLTFFYFFVVLFNINVTSSRLHGVVWFSQALSMPALARIIMLAAQNKSLNFLKAAKICLMFYSFWNLDIFRSVIPDICLNITTLQALALDYLLAFYPFLLILFSHLVIKLYDSHVPFLVMVWKPFRALLAKFRRSMDVRTSVIDSFATFFLLSYIKVLSVTSDLLIPTQIYQLGSNISTFGLYNSPTVVYFGEEHLPYAILAIFIFALFVCVPTVILLLYPFQFFQRFLSLLPFNTHYLHAFVDSFQGCYKDGTEPGTFDCRWFATLMLLLRLILFIIFTLTLSMMFFVYTVITFVIFLIILVNIQPFNKAAVRYPTTDSTFMILLSFCFIANIGRDIASMEEHFYYSFVTTIVLLSAAIPVLYIASFIIYWLVIKVKQIHQLANGRRHQK